MFCILEAQERFMNFAEKLSAKKRYYFLKSLNHSQMKLYDSCRKIYQNIILFRIHFNLAEIIFTYDFDEKNNEANDFSPF